MTIISTRRLCKAYGQQRVLHDVDLNIESGKLVGFLGPNGAGKTTTIRILLGLLASGSGTAEVLGKSCWAYGKDIRSQIGYLPGDVHLYPAISGRATLRHFARVRKQNCDDEIDRLSSLFDLPLNRMVRKYSTGMRQKLGLIQAFMHCPDLLMLDEPTSALDPLIRTKVFDELRKVVESGRSVLFSSHSLDEVETLCDEVIILRDGRVVEHQQIDVLRSRALRKVEITFASADAVPDQLASRMQLIDRTDNTIVCTWSGEIRALMDWLAPLSIEDLIIERPDLNDLFITYYAHKETNLPKAAGPSGNVAKKESEGSG